jgi:chromosome segregation protein
MPIRLKSLELQGYKTFASRYQFDFGGAVTAIVGPNGSGKSNIVDALRWVLGEQSFSLLRGRKTEDMIFSGSEQRSRAGMASASVSFDNSDGWLPIDFSEVAVTRRAYRDGQNEYLINGQRVRLRDVSELLAQSGLAERTYTIIGQGLVDAALSLRADERRRLFEEAAGIGLHRARREEALRRLEATRRNLERVEDILAELAPRLRSLEKQARRTQEYEQVQAELRLLLREWYGYHWHHSQQELVHVQEAAQRQEEHLEQVRRQQEGVAHSLSGLREQIHALRAQLNSWHRQLAQLHNQRETFSRELAVADERSRLLSEQRSAGQIEAARLEEELGLLEDRARQAAEELDGRRQAFSEASQQFESARQALQSRQAERSQLETGAQDLRRELTALNTRRSQLQARLGERQAQAQQQAAGLGPAEQEVKAAEAELQSLRQRIAEAAQAEQRQAGQRRQAEEAAERHQAALQALESERQAAQKAQADQQAQAARLQAQLDVLEQAEQALLGYADGARLLLAAAREARLAGTAGALSSRLEVPAALEAAIAAALGEYVDAVLIQAEHGADQALDLLAGQAARAVLLPLPWLAPAAPLRPPADPACLGVAADLVRVEAALRPAVDLLLGQVLVARDRTAARRLLAGQPPQARVVTLQGEVFHASGPVASGGGGREAGGALGRLRQQRQAQAELARASQQLVDQQAALDELQARLEAMSAEGAALEQAVQAARRQAQQAAEQVKRLELEAAQAQRQLAWQQEQLKRLQADIQATEQLARQMTAEQKAVEEKIEQTQAGLRGLQTRLAELPVDDLQAQAAHWSTQQAVAERSAADGERRLGEARAALARAEQSQRALQARLEGLQQAIARLEQEKAALHRSEAEVAGQTETFQRLVEPAEASLEGLEGEQDQVQTVEETARQALSQAEHRHAQARIVLNRHQEALETLRRRIEDDFGLVAFNYVQEVTGPTPLPLEGMVERLPLVTELSPDLDDALQRKRTQLRRMGPVNPDAAREYQEVKERYEFLTAQVADLQKAEADIRQVIHELDSLMQREFGRTFEAVAAEFRAIFARLFGGGSARLVLTDPQDLTHSGIDIEARLPGRRTQGLSLLSGGERSLTAAALVFALLKTSPTPFCVLDEVDAMLDEANVGRFRELLRELSQTTQFIIITHNRNTVQVADVIYGVTMGRDSTSQVLGLRLDQVGDLGE